jgi:hypothetical protein
VSVLEKLIAQREKVQTLEKVLHKERVFQRQLMLACKRDRHSNGELAKAMDLSRERVSVILKGTGK